MKTLQRRIFDILEFETPGRASNLIATFVTALILLNVAAVMLETVAEIYEAYAPVFLAFEALSVIVFTVEYLTRAWACTADPRYAGSLRGRLKFLKSPMALIDLLAILPAYLALVGVDLRFLRILRLFRLVKMTRYARSFQVLAHVLRGKRRDLTVALFIVSILLVFSSSFMYYVEHDVQPEAFASIPATMWWSIATLTTVGYGDVYPITPVGRLLGAVTALLGISLFALPAGILASGFSDALKAQNREPRMRPDSSDEPAAEESTRRVPVRACPHCGGGLESPMEGDATLRLEA